MRRWWVVLVGASWLDAQERTWTFQPARDTFSSEAVLDLRYLNEEIAGERGFVRANTQGDLLDGAGGVIRFWGVNTTVGREQPYVSRPLWRQDEPSLAVQARFLAKRGVNLVRLNANLNPDPRSGKAQLNEINAKDRDWIWRAVAAFKREGIYTVISPYWADQMRFDERWGIAGGEQDAHGLLFIDERLQAAYRGWLKALYDPVNPHTGLRLADDPAVALIQLQHGDSLLDWTTNRLRGPQRESFGRKYFQWVVARYGSWARAREAWRPDELPGDAPGAGVLDFHDVYDITFEEEGGLGRRLSDQTRFWVETMRGFDAAMVKYLRGELGCKQLINAGDARTADFAHLEDLERYVDATADVLAVSRHWQSIHYGRNKNSAIVEGDIFVSPSALKSSLPFPLGIKQVRGYPMLVTEGLWTPPIGYAAESTLLVAAYQSLTGMDGFLWHTTAEDGFEPPQSVNGYMNSLAKWTLGGPDVLGMFPAAAFLYRKGYLKQGDPVLVEARPLDDMMDRKPPMVAEGAKPGWEQAAFLAGPVELIPGGRPADTKQVNVRSLMDGPRVKSVTGEIVFDREKGCYAFDSPKAQGVAAFFAAQNEFRFRDVTIDARHEHGAVFVISIDELPLRESGRVLVQVGTKARPDGWQERAVDVPDDGAVLAGYQVNDIGKAPWRVTAADLTVEVRNARLRRARALDANGYAIADVDLENVPGGVKFRFPLGTLYVVLD